MARHDLQDAKKYISKAIIRIAYIVWEDWKEAR